jgi:predicted nucleic acid-binding protein
LTAASGAVVLVTGDDDLFAVEIGGQAEVLRPRELADRL